MLRTRIAHKRASKNKQHSPQGSIFYPPPPRGGGGGIWPKGLRGKENENLLTQFAQKLEQNDQKCDYFYTIANICKGEKI